MRRHFMVTGLALAPLMLVGSVESCKKKAVDPAPVVSASVAATVEAASPRARIGGILVNLGDYVAEVLVHAEGQIEALLMDRTGQLHPTPAEVSLVVKANTAGGADTDVKLAWDQGRARFVGTAAGGTKLASGPLQVDLSLPGKTTQGRVALAPVVTGPRFGGRLLALGELGAEALVSTDGHVAAHLWDTKLEPITGKAGANVRAVMRMGAGAAQTVALHWVEPTAQFEGKADLSGALAPIDLELKVDLGGQQSAGAMAGLALAGETHHGGVVMMVGDYSAEVVAKTGGLVEAFVMDASGKAHASGDLGVSLVLVGMPAIELKWDAPSASYRAQLAAGLDLSQTPGTLRIESGGRVNVGALASLKASAEASASAKVAAESASRALGKAKADLKIQPPGIQVVPPKLGADAHASVGTGSGAKADAKATVKAPSIGITPPSVKAGAAASAKTGAKGGFKLGL